MAANVPNPHKASFNPMNVIASLIVLGIFGLLFSSIDGGCFHHSYRRASARRISCASNMKFLGTAIVQYSQDNDDAMPNYATTDGKQTWREATYPFVKSSGIYHCPESSDDGRVNGSNNLLSPDYAANYIGSYQNDQGWGTFVAPGAVPLHLTSMMHPENALMLVEQRHHTGPEWNIVNVSFCPPAERVLYAQHFGGVGNYLFVDGHVKAKKPRDTLDPVNLWTRDNSAFIGQDLANAQAVLKHAQEE